MNHTMLLFLIVATLPLVMQSLNPAIEKAPGTATVEQNEHSVLVFSKTAGFRHNSIEDGIEAVKKLGEEHGFSVTATEDASLFTEENLANYDAVLFLNTTGTVLNAAQKEAFRQFIRSGGGFVGVHSATDTEYEWAWYGQMVGAYFESHPHVQTATLLVTDASHPSTAHLSGQWEKEDEWYNFNYVNRDVNVLLELDTESYEGSKHPGDHPIAWYHDYDGGRAFYTGLGHTPESFTDEIYLKHLLGGIQYALGKE